MHTHRARALFTLLISVGILYSAGDPGDYTFELAPDAASQGRGGGSAAEINAEALYHNPAGLSFNIYNSVTIGRQVRESFDLTTFSYIHPFTNAGVVGIAFYNDALSSVHNQYSEFGEHIGSDQGGEREVVIGYGYNFLDMIGVGLNFKMAHQEVASYTDMGFGFDLGLLYNYQRTFMAGVSLVNLFGPEMQLVNVSESYATVLKTAVASHLLNEILVMSADVDIVNILGGEDPLGNELKRSSRYRLGVAFSPIKYGTIRTGVNGVNVVRGITDDVWYSVGAGLTVNNFSVDYAFSTSLLSDDAEIGMGSNHYVSLNYLIGKPYEKEKEDLIQRVKDLESQISLNNARQSFIDKEYKDALNQIQEYLVVYPMDSSALEFKSEIRGEINRERVVILEIEFIETINNNQLIKAKAIIDDIVLLSPQYENLPELQKSLVTAEQVETLFTSIKNLTPDSEPVKIIEGLVRIYELNPDFAQGASLEKTARPYYNQLKAKELYTTASSLFYEKKDVQAAHQKLKEALILDKDNSEAKKLYEELTSKLRAQLLKQAASGDEDAVLEQMVALDLDQQIIEANNLFDDKDFESAEVVLNKILRKNSAHPGATVLLEKVKKASYTQTAKASYQEALLAFNSGDMKKAFALVSKTIEIDPIHTKAIELKENMIATTLTDARNALESFRKSQVNTDLKLARDLLDALIEGGTSTEEITALQLGVSTEERVLSVLIQIENGEYKNAEKELNDILLSNPDSKSAKSAFEMLNELKEILQ